jgi:trk system potassium uptake protein TrkH
MQSILQKLPFLLELFFNGTFILLYSLKTAKKIPENWNIEYINKFLELGTTFIPIILFFAVLVNYLNSKSFEDYLRKYIFSFVIFIPMVVTWGDLEFCFWLAAPHLLSSILALYDEGEYNPEPIEPKGKMKIMSYVRLSPAQIVLISFAGVIMLGTFLLMLPVSAAEGQKVNFIDALFTSTSAVCVTGLSTISVADNLSLFGQIVLLALIQIGGLSIMTLYSSMAILLGKSLRMKDRILMQDLLDVSSLEELFAMIISIVKYTFFIELWGAIVLTIGFTFEGFEFGTAIYYGFFHAISAFCNAGFAMFNNSLENYAGSPLIHGTIAALITLGGLGFVVLKEMHEVILRRKSIKRFSIHTKIVLITSFILTASGAIMIFFGEFLNALDHYTLWEKIQISFFQSVTLRTAGFNSIPLTGLHSYTIYAMCLYMFIGASPGSTGGGIKTTTLAILIQSIWATMKGEKKVDIGDRSISQATVVKSIAITFISIVITSIFILIMMKVEPQQSFLSLFFEVISAIGTVGLSLGLTPYLTFAGKFVICLVMFTGRIGPLTLLLAIGERREARGKFDYPEGRIMIG